MAALPLETRTFLTVVCLLLAVTWTSYRRASVCGEQQYSPKFFDYIPQEEEQLQLTQQESNGEISARERAAAFDQSGLLPVKLQYLIAFEKEVTRKLQEKPGSWPFNDETRCNKSNTRDSSYNKYHSDKGSGDKVKQLRSKYPRCGITGISQTDSSSDDEEDEDVDERLDNWPTAATAFAEVITNLKRLSSVHHKPIINNEILRSKESGATANDKPVVVKSHSTRIVGGHVTPIGEWPWLAAVGRKASGPKCGGTLIADQWVLSAAHCFKEREKLCNFNVRVGSRNWMYDEHNTHQDLDIDAIFRHPEYNDEDNSNDVALLKLSRPVTLHEKSHINAVCLPKRSRSVKIGTVCKTAGWGKIEADSNADVLELRQVEIPVVSYGDKCGEYDNGTIKEGMICAGYVEGGRDTCQGDSGGPLVYRHRNQWTLLGITSFGLGCAKKGYPGIYTDVGHHLRWIASVVDRYSDTI